VKDIDTSDVAVIAEVCEKSGEEIEDGFTPEQILKELAFVGESITDGAISFLGQEYLYLGLWSALFAAVLVGTVDSQEMHEEKHATNFPYTAVAYLIGSATSIVAGYVGMRIAVYTNTRTTYQCCKSTHDGFLAAFRGGQVLGFVLVGLALLVLELILITFKATWYDAEVEIILKDTELADENARNKAASKLTRRLFELVAGYGLGGSSVALFGRVGGGIYTKAADVGADLVGKTLEDLKEDDPRNPGTIADNVGDNVGDIAGMGADLFGSLAESTCAALVVSATSIELLKQEDALYFPLMITAAGILASFLSVLLVHFWTVRKDNCKAVLTYQLFLSTGFMTVAVIPLVFLLPETFSFPAAEEAKAGEDAQLLEVKRWTAYWCIFFGLWSGLVIGFITEYYTSKERGPTQYLAKSCDNGPAPNIIQGLALGYLSCVIPILCIAATIGFAFSTAGMYGIGLSALGMLGSLPVALTIDGYGPISDNAGGIAEMSRLPSTIRAKTDALDAAGNTTAAIGKGFAIGSACLVGLALFGAFITRVEDTSVNILRPTAFAGLLVGAMLPYAFSAMTMKAVGDAALDMMDFIKKDYKRCQDNEKAGLSGADTTPDYQECIRISTTASLRKMVAPGALVLGSPLFAGFVFGPRAVAGLLAGAIVSGVQVAISASNSGGAWDNAKKFVEGERAAFKDKLKAQGTSPDEVKAQAAELDAEDESEEAVALRADAAYAVYIKEKHVAAVVGDTVGDPLKDTSGPAINILIKLSAITSLVFGGYIKKNSYYKD